MCPRGREESDTTWGLNNEVILFIYLSVLAVLGLQSYTGLFSLVVASGGYSLVAV